jgi:hypothetical protein
MAEMQILQERISALLPTILKTKQEITPDLKYLWFVNRHAN